MNAERMGHRTETKLAPGRKDSATLRTRLLIGGQGLNPDAKPKQKLTPELLGNFQDRNYTFVQKASTIERVNTYENDHNSFDIQLDAWRNQVVKGIKAKHGEFFEGDNGQSHRDRVGRLGLIVDGTDAEIADSAKMLFDKYLSDPENPQKGVKLFVGDILNLYRGDATSPVDIDALRQDLPLYTWIGGVFGNASTVVISELIEGEGEISNPNLKSVLIENQNKKSMPIVGERKVNRLSAQEKTILGFVYSANNKLFIPEPYKQDVKIIHTMETNQDLNLMPPAPIRQTAGVPLASDDEDDTNTHPIAA